MEIKQKKIEEINNINDLLSLVSELLDKMKLDNISILENNVIKGKVITALKERNTHFILTLSELNGKVISIGDMVNKVKEGTDDIVIITSNRKLSNYFEKWIKEDYCNFPNIDFWANKQLVEFIDKYLPTYWKHNDIFIQTYEENFIQKLKSDKEFQQLLKLDEKYDNLLNVFVEPKIYKFVTDPETVKTTTRKLKIEHLLNGENYVISGEAGTGKSTILKEVGKKILERNQTTQRKSIPILIKAHSLLKKEFNLTDVIDSELQDKFSSIDIQEVKKNYHFTLLIDSLDEFELSNRKMIMDSLNIDVQKEGVNFILCTRNYESLTSECNICNHSHAYLVNLDVRQVKSYLEQFFRFQLGKADELWEILRENNTLEKIPMTPLTISLISILYEDKGYELPATITDVYDNFNSFLLGKLTVNSRLDFLNINIKKRLLSSYALNIISSENRIKKKTDEFINYVIDFFKNRSITIETDLVPDLLKSLTDGTGILYIDDNHYVSFKHDHFMEYYASIEIFDHHRETHEKTLIDRFNDFNWQNTAIFYTGRTRDMPDFLQRLVEHLKSYKLFNDCLLGVSGIGYVLQSLWMTDSTIRKEGVKVALDLLIKANDEANRLAASKFPFFQDMKFHTMSILNLAWFYGHFNSITLRDTLNLAFDDIYQNFTELRSSIFHSDTRTLLYQLFCIAATLDKGRNADKEKLEKLFNEDGILNIPLFVLLFETGLDLLETEHRKSLKKDFKLKNKIKKYKEGIKFYLNNQASDLRFTTLENFTTLKNIEIYTEGQSDAIIISHAFSVLTNHKNPSWNLSSCEIPLKANSGGAHSLSKLLTLISNKIQTDHDIKKTVIGIFDNDAKGHQEFNGLDKKFELIDNRTKKHKELNIYALKLPIPISLEYKNYIQEKQSFKLFEIEHYFPIRYLKEKNMVNETSIPDVFEIKDKKSSFSEQIINEKDTVLFKNFITLFHEIDKISGENINYIE